MSMKNLIAILRGVTPGEAVAIGAVLVEAGFVRIEVPLNSPESPLESIALLAREFCGVAEIGAGTVLGVEEVQPVLDAGGCFVVSPNCNVDVIRETKRAGMLSIPGVVTPSECFAALTAGADALKLFPAALVGVAGVRALREVLPKEDLLAVGGMDETTFAEWKAAGASGFGVAGKLYRPGMTAEEVGKRARAIVAGYKGLVD